MDSIVALNLLKQSCGVRTDNLKDKKPLEQAILKFHETRSVEDRNRVIAQLAPFIRTQARHHASNDILFDDLVQQAVLIFIRTLDDPTDHLSGYKPPEIVSYLKTTVALGLGDYVRQLRNGYCPKVERKSVWFFPQYVNFEDAKKNGLLPHAVYLTMTAELEQRQFIPYVVRYLNETRNPRDVQIFVSRMRWNGEYSRQELAQRYNIPVREISRIANAILKCPAFMNHVQAFSGTHHKTVDFVSLPDLKVLQYRRKTFKDARIFDQLHDIVDIVLLHFKIGEENKCQLFLKSLRDPVLKIAQQVTVLLAFEETVCDQVDLTTFFFGNPQIHSTINGMIRKARARIKTDPSLAKQIVLLRQKIRSTT
jgi:hypothetical protein